MQIPPQQTQQFTPTSSYKRYPNRPVNFIGFHHTATTAIPSPTSLGSWHRLFAQDSTVYNAVPHDAAAFTILKTDLWRPSYIVRCPDSRVSDANYCGLQYEINYAPQNNEVPTPQQYDSLRWALQVDTARYGPIPILPHGLVQSDKWRTEPHMLDYSKLGLVWQPNFGYIYNPENEMQNPATDLEIKGWLETYGMPVNMDTAIMKFVADAFRDGPPPVGYYRGPARPAPGLTVNDPGEYTHPDGTIRHRFSQGIVKYDPNTGGVGWAETINEHPEID